VTHELPNSPSSSQSDLDDLYEFAPCGYISTRLDGTICRVNETFVDLLGWPRADLLGGHKFQELMTMAGRVFYDTHFGPLIRIKGFVKEIACDLLRNDGSKVPVLMNAVRAEAKCGGEATIRFTIFDATERRQFENNLLEARRRADHYKTIVQASADAILSFDAAGAIQTWNPGASQLFGYSESEAVGKDVWETLRLEGGADAVDKIMATLRSGRAVLQTDIARQRSGENVDVLLSLTPHIEPGGELVSISAIIRDVTERQRMIKAKHQQELLQNLIESQEAERQRFARDLHDHLGQQLTGLRLALGNLSATISDPDTVETIDGIKEQALRIDREISFIAFELRPNILQQMGLFEAIENFVAEWSRNYAIPAYFRGARQNALRLSPEIEINLYRITQECLNNVLKHARAKTVTVILEERGMQVSLIIEDDGRGFSPEEKDDLVKISGHGLGLLGMHERAAVIGGAFQVESAVDSGTTVFVRAPVVYVDDTSERSLKR
jgi:PAS domain S-box-containing protein